MDAGASVIHESDIQWIETTQGEAFRSRRKKLGGSAGARMLGASIYELPPGASAFPYHYHCANEELIYVLEGEGVLRLGDQRILVRAGSFAAMPPGPAHAHRLYNTSDAPLRYLCVSSMITPEICVYPDSSKIGVMAGSAPGGDPAKRTLSGVYPKAASVDYYDGEPGA
ncbi:MAG: cupin domain-containing protein [Candidatus Binataceae bacterium]|jgi:uncharacterized cupin superfamily protein